MGFKIVEVKKSVWEKLRTVREKDEYITYLLSSNHIIWNIYIYWYIEILKKKKMKNNKLNSL